MNQPNRLFTQNTKRSEIYHGFRYVEDVVKQNNLNFWQGLKQLKPIYDVENNDSCFVTFEITSVTQTGNELLDLALARLFLFAIRRMIQDDVSKGRAPYVTSADATVTDFVLYHIRDGRLYISGASDTAFLSLLHVPTERKQLEYRLMIGETVIKFNVIPSANGTAFDFYSAGCV